MEEKSRNMTDEHLSRQLRKSKGGKLGGKLLSLLGGVVAIAGIILGGNIVQMCIRDRQRHQRHEPPAPQRQRADVPPRHQHPE